MNCINAIISSSGWSHGFSNLTRGAQNGGRVAPGRMNRPPAMKRAATAAAARMKGHRDDQLLERNGAVEETTIAISAV
jgi:hypothetical protein